MESGEQEKDKQNSSTAKNQDNMAATSKFALFAVLLKFPNVKLRNGVQNRFATSASGQGGLLRGEI